jgi:hypothetical protein
VTELTPEITYLRVVEETSAEFPRFKIVPKSDSGFMGLLNVLLLVITCGAQKDFMTSFTTTIGSRMWVPSKWGSRSPLAKAAVLRHERVHLRQQKRYGMLRYALMYLFWPVPLFWATGRTKLEMEAYAESLAAYSEYFGDGYINNGKLREAMVDHFTSGEYGWMCINRGKVERWYDAVVGRLLAR